MRGRMTRRRMGFAIVTAMAMLGAAPAASALAQTTPTPAALLAAAKSWGYQLQKIRPAVIASAPYDVVVIDYSADGTDAKAFSAADVAALKAKPDGSRRVVLAYLSIGEAETYRYYWNADWETTPPPWLGETNKRWRTNVIVRFWEEGWQGVI